MERSASWKLAVRGALLVGGATALLLATSARTAAADGTAPRRVVTVTIQGAREDARALEATIRGLLARLQLSVVTKDQVPPASLLESVTIDLDATFGAHVVVRTASGATVLDRNIARAETPAIQREQIAHAVRGAAEAELLVDGDRVAGRAPPVVEAPATPTSPTASGPGATPEPATTTVSGPEATPKPAPSLPVPGSRSEPPPRALAVDERDAPAPPPGSGRRELALDVSTYAGAGAFAEGSVVARVGGAFSTWLRRDGVRPGLSVMGLYAFPFDAGDEVVEARTSVLSLRALPSASLVRTSSLSLEIGVGGGLDVVTVNPTSTVLPPAALGAKTTRTSGVFTGAVTGRLAIASDVALTLTALLDVDPSSRRYVFDGATARSEVLAPWAARPMLLAGLAFTALGPAR